MVWRWSILSKMLMHWSLESPVWTILKGSFGSWDLCLYQQFSHWWTWNLNRLFEKEGRPEEDGDWLEEIGTGWREGWCLEGYLALTLFFLFPSVCLQEPSCSPFPEAHSERPNWPWPKVPGTMSQKEIFLCASRGYQRFTKETQTNLTHCSWAGDVGKPMECSQMVSCFPWLATWLWACDPCCLNKAWCCARPVEAPKPAASWGCWNALGSWVHRRMTPRGGGMHQDKRKNVAVLGRSASNPSLPALVNAGGLSFHSPSTSPQGLWAHTLLWWLMSLLGSWTKRDFSQRMSQGSIVESLLGDPWVTCQLWQDKEVPTVGNILARVVGITVSTMHTVGLCQPLYSVFFCRKLLNKIRLRDRTQDTQRHTARM